MTESEYISSTNPEVLLAYLAGSTLVSERKLRLLATAFCRNHAGHRFYGQAWAETLAEACQVAEEAADDRRPLPPWRDGTKVRQQEETAFTVHMPNARQAAELCITSTWQPGHKEARTEEANIIRCVAGNPFRPVVANPDWFTPLVTGMARRIYDERDWAAMPILADAIDDIGTDHKQQAVLNHLRGFELYHCGADGYGWRRGSMLRCRGDWVLDLLLGLR